LVAGVLYRTVCFAAGGLYEDIQQKLCANSHINWLALFS